MNPESRPNIARVKSIFDSDDSEDESSSIADNINALLKATASSPSQSSSNSCKGDNDIPTSSNATDDIIHISDNVHNKNTINEVKKYDSLTFDDVGRSKSVSSSTYESSDESVPDRPVMLRDMKNLLESDEDVLSVSSEGSIKVDTFSDNTSCPIEKPEEHLMFSVHEKPVPISTPEEKLPVDEIGCNNSTFGESPNEIIDDEDHSDSITNFSEEGASQENLKTISKSDDQNEGHSIESKASEKIESQKNKTQLTKSISLNDCEELSQIDSDNKEIHAEKLKNDSKTEQVGTAPRKGDKVEYSSTINIKSSLTSNDVEIKILPLPLSEEDGYIIDKEQLKHNDELKKMSIDETIHDMSIDEIDNLKSEKITKETHISHDTKQVTDMDVDENNLEISLIEKQEINENKSMNSSSTNGSTASSDDDLVIDETVSTRDKDLIGFRSTNVSKKKLVEDIFTDSDISDTEYPQRKVPKLLLKKSYGLEGTIVLPVSEGKEKKKNVPTIKKKPIRKARLQNQNLAELVSVFEKGWRREVVLSGKNANRADIYYYSPSGQKLRSRVEIENYIKQEGLVDTKISSFSFAKEPLGVEAKYENVRSACVRNCNGENQILHAPMYSVVGHDKPAKPLPDKQRVIVPKQITKRTTPLSTQHRKLAPKPTRKAGSTNTKPQVSNYMKQSVTTYTKPPVTTYTKPPVPTSPKSPVSTYMKPSVPTYMKPTESITKNISYSSYVPQNTMTYTTSPLNNADLPNVQQQSVLTPLLVGENKEKTYHCTAHCSKAVGLVPNLQCVTCLCLFHHECCFMPEKTVTLILASHAKFLCPNCYKIKSEQGYRMSFNIPQYRDPLSFIISDDEDDEGLGCDMADDLPQHEVQMRPVTPAHLEIVHSCNEYPTKQISSEADTSEEALFVQQIEMVPTSLSSFITTEIVPTANLIGSLHETLETGKDYLPMELATPFKKWGPQLNRHLFEDICTGYAILKKVFSYLDLPNLLVMAQVCGMWKDLAYNSIYWNNVRLRNLCIKDVSKMVRFLKQRRTKHLDMRKMVFKIRTPSPTQKDEQTFIEENSPTIKKETCEETTNDSNHLSQVDTTTVLCDNVVATEVSSIDDVLQQEDSASQKVDNTKQMNNSMEQNSVIVDEEASGSIESTISTLAHIKDSAIASTSGCQIRTGVKRQREDEFVSTKAKNKKTVDILDMNSDSFLSEHDYYLDIPADEKPSGQCLTITEEVVDSRTVTSDHSMEIDSEQDLTDVVPDKLAPKKEKNNIATDPVKNISTISHSRLPKQQNILNDKQTQFGGQIFQQQKPTDEGDYYEWHNIFEEISKLDCLESITVGNVESTHLEILLYYCHQLKSLTVSNLSSSSGCQSCFDPSYLMPVKNLRELKFICSKQFSFKSNFNFIKLQNLQNLMLKGLLVPITGWPYMGTTLTHLHLSPIDNFSKNNWENLANMSKLVHLELESCFDDTSLSASLLRMKNLKRIGLYDFRVGSKLGLALKRMHNIESLFVIPAKEDKDDVGLYAGRVLLFVQTMKGLKEFQWGVQPSVFIESQPGKIYLRDLKDDQTPRPISVESLEGYIKQRKPSTHIVVKGALVSKFHSE